MMKKLIGVIGGRDATPELEEIAYQVGRLIAKNSYGLVCGGRGGIMEAAARGCAEQGGLTVGILLGEDTSEANPYIQVAIPTGLGIARNLLVVRAAEGLIAIDGKFGTLSEIAFALQLEKPLVGIYTWDVEPTMPTAQSAEEAMQKLLSMIA
ncbi:TIGR00725 family protein [Caldithrix abyssi]|uniref:TIGR00725 family protein n=1 Tax=Caldithrix abyssi DSM 13497 TaxID=880073 RepID=H1XWW4_CALAY|nr:TIGR00725 family protein [Caldithrix abyssi]APF19171.1 hypothetical protein Cabys_2422 [Caldithrix abyssi DSM 13497]EHO43090.1 Conserved hypothetical protein CHP00725 [Caldithrix abyssi DSM 13497]